MRSSLLLLAACGHPWHATPAQLASIPVEPSTARTVGPLAGGPTTSWRDQQQARALADDHYLDRERIHSEGAQYLAVIDAFFQPVTPETKIGFDQTHRAVRQIEGLAPYSVFSVALAYQQSSEPLRICIEGANLVGPCDRDVKPRPPRTGPLFEVTDAEGIATLALHDLSNADDPAWQAFAETRRQLSEARGLVIDLRDAAGADPRAILPYISELVGRKLAPLRAIERPTSADGYVAAYRARFTDGPARDPEIWRALVGGDGPATDHVARPIAVVVGRYCEAACELIARVLETYAGATITGGLTRTHRLARDEPALLVLPHSQTSVYFRATRYFLDAAIEAATGPTEEWRDGVDPVDGDYIAFAISDVAHRLGGGWKRCDALAPVAVSGAGMRCGRGGIDIAVTHDGPRSAIERFLATCGSPIVTAVYVPGKIMLRGDLDASLLGRIAAGELVKRVDVSCSVEPELD